MNRFEFYTALEHSGIKGQKWGERRYQNPDGTYTELGKERRRIKAKGERRKKMLIEEELGMSLGEKKLKSNRYSKNKGIEMKAGEKVSHVTPLKFENLREGQDLFVSATDYDKDMYRSFLTLMMRHKGYGKDIPIQEVEFTLKEDLKSPSSNQQRIIFENFYDQNKELVDKDLNNYYSDSKKTRPSDVYDAYVKVMDSSKALDTKKRFYEEIQRNGYNAVLDEHDIDGSWMQAQQPLIIIDATKTLGKMKGSKITDEDIKKSIKRLYF